MFSLRVRSVLFLLFLRKIQTGILEKQSRRFLLRDCVP